MLRTLILATSFIIGLSSITTPAAAQANGPDPQVEVIARGLGIVWGIAPLNRDGSELVVTSRNGRLGYVNGRGAEAIWLQPAPQVYARGQGGLLDIALHPDFPSAATGSTPRSGWVYVSYSKVVGSFQTTAVARATLSLGPNPGFSAWEEIFEARTDSSSRVHYGSRLAFDESGSLFVTIGDRGQRDKAQDLSWHNGKVLRLTQTGAPHPDNPFINTSGALPEIYSYGHRNAQGLHYDGRSLWEMEHGPRGGDEINLVSRGANYGWPVITFGREYHGPSIGEGTHRPGMEQPVKYFTPSIAPSGLWRYQGNLFSQWRGCLLSGALKLTHLNVVCLNPQGQATSETRYLSSRDQRIRVVVATEDGAVLLGNDNGQVLRLTPSSR